MRKFLAVMSLVAATSGLVACGGSDSSTGATTAGSSNGAASSAAKLSGDDKAAFDAINGKLGEDDGVSSDITDEQQSCVAVGMVKGLGAKRVIEISGEEDLVLNESEANKAADVFLGCVDVQKMFASEFAADGTLSEKSAACLAKKIDMKQFKPFLVKTFQGSTDEDLPSELMASVLSGMGTCLSSDELKSMGK
jgi:hypothetical protein